MKKLRDKKGFTLMEMLISVLLLGFVSVMVTVMSSAILSSTVTMKEVAQAEILGSEALDNVQEQLRVAQNVTWKGEGNVTFDRDDTNKDYMLAIEDGMIVLGKVKDGALSDETTLLFAGSSYGNLKIADLKFSLEGETSIGIALSVAYGNKTLWSGNVSVRPLNGVAIV